jgi:hypothetical protein
VNISLRVHELFEEVRVARFFMKTVRCEWESLEQELEHDDPEGEDLHLVDIFHSLVDILFWCHIAGGTSVINDIFSLRKMSFVHKITGNAEICHLKLDWHVSTISKELVFLSEAYHNI